MEILQLILGLVFLALLLLFLPQVLYLNLLTVAGIYYRKPNAQKRALLELERTATYPSMVILIPAHDEAMTLPATLLEFKKLSLDRKELVKPEIVVIADNCTDNTAELAREAGVTVYERTDLVNRGKGHALRWALEKLPQDFPDYQAVVIFDADTMPERNFMVETAAAYQRGVKIMQGRYDVLRPEENWRTGLMQVAFALFNHVRPLGRATLRLSDGLKGNGMMFTRQVLEELPWNSYSLVEDIEYTTRLVEAGYRVQYAPEAALYGQAPSSGKQALSQRMRWEGGRGAQARRDIPRLFKATLQRRSFVPFDRAMDLIILPLGLLFAAIVAAGLLNLGLALLVGGGLLGFTALMWGISVALIFSFVLLGLLVARVPARAYLSLLYAPFYIVWKMWVYFILLTKRLPREWVRTERAKIEAPDAKSR